MNSQWEKKKEKSAKTSYTITRVMQRQKDERIERNGMWGEFGPVPTHASSS